MTVRNPLALLGFAALCVLAAVALILAGHPVPEWLAVLPQVSLLGGAAVMTPGLQTVKQLLGTGTATLAPTATELVPATVGLDPAAIEPVSPA